MRSTSLLASQSAQSANFVLEMTDISKSFYNIKVLDSVTFKVKTGEVHALVGENGAGKSTLMKILMGIYGRDGGEIILDHQKVVFQNPREAIDRGISDDLPGIKLSFGFGCC